MCPLSLFFPDRFYLIMSTPCFFMYLPLKSIEKREWICRQEQLSVCMALHKSHAATKTSYEFHLLHILKVDKK